MADLHFIFIHGTFGSPRDWKAVQQTIENETNYTASAVTLPGHAGRSLQEDSSVVAQLTAALEEELTQRCIVVGYSLGGRVALHTLLGAARPLPVCALVLEGAHPGIDDPAERDARAQLDSQRAEELRRRGAAAFLRDWYRLPLFGLERLSTAAFDALIEARTRDANAYDLARILEDASPGRVPSLWSELNVLSLPLLYLFGEKDTKYRAVGHRIARVCRTTTVRSIAHAGHNAHRDAPDEYARVLIQFAEQRANAL